MRGDRPRVIVEEFIDFDYEITLLTVRTADGILFCPPIGHRQERGDYRESWQPMAMSDAALAEAQDMARAVVDDLGGHGIFGVEFFIARRRGDLLRTEPAPARYRHGHPDLAESVASSTSTPAPCWACRSRRSALAARRPRP